MGDLTSRRWIVAKGLMFALIVAMSGFGLIVDEDPWRRAVLLPVCLWAACRWYYFLFYVLEKYVGVEGRYTSLMDLCQRLWQRRR